MKARASMGTRRGRLRLVAIFGVVALGLAACGGSGKKTSASNTTTTASGSSSSDQSSTTSSSVATGDTSTTAAGGGGAAVTTATTAKKTTGTTAKRTSSAVTQPTKTNAPVAGIVNVGAGSTTTTAGGTPPQPGGILTQIIQSENQGFDPTKMGINGASTDGTGGAALYDALLYNDPFDGQTHPNIADSMSSPDGLVWTMKIHPNVKFSDGTPYDANAVKFNYLRHQDPATGSIRAGFANQIGDMTVVDPLTLKLTLKAVNFLFPRIVATNLGWIASPQALQQSGDYNTHPVGAGPFLFKSWARGSSMTFVRNPNYWRAPLPYLDGLVLKIITDSVQQGNSYKANEGDILSGPSQATAESFKNDSKIVSLELLAGTNVEFNVAKGPFADVRLRRAWVHAFDRTAYAAAFKLTRPQNSVMPPVTPYYDPAVVQLPFDQNAATTEFAQVVADQGPLNITLGYVSNAQTQPIAEYIQAIMQKYKDIKVTLQPATLQVAISKLTSGDFQAYEFGGSYNDPDPWAQNFLCNSRPAPNVVGFCDPKFDQLAATGRSSQDVAARVAAYKEAQKIIYDQAPMMYYEPAINFFVFRSNLHDVRQFENGAIFYGDLWIQTH